MPPDAGGDDNGSPDTDDSNGAAGNDDNVDCNGETGDNNDDDGNSALGDNDDGDGMTCNYRLVLARILRLDYYE